MSNKNCNRLPHDVVDSDAEFYLFENQKTIASEIGTFSVSVLGDRKGQSVTIETFVKFQMQQEALLHQGETCREFLS